MDQYEWLQGETWAMIAATPVVGKTQAPYGIPAQFDAVVEVAVFCDSHTVSQGSSQLQLNP